jgi:hypothetical protein
VTHLNVDFAILTTFLGGLFILLLGVLHLGWLYHFPSLKTISNNPENYRISSTIYSITCGRWIFVGRSHNNSKFPIEIIVWDHFGFLQ